MLGIMRKYKDSIVIKIVFVVIVASFIGTIFLVWGRGDRSEGGQRGFAAKVNGTKIGLDEFQKSYYRTRSIYEQIYGRTMNPEVEKQLGLKKLTLDSLIDNVLIRDEADRMGIKVSSDEVAAAIAKVPAFQKDGAFNFDQYQQTLRVNRITPKEFEQGEKDDLLVKKTREKITDGATLSDQELLQAYKKQNDKVDLQYVSYSANDVKGEVKLTDQELTSYLQNHEAAFKTPEQISIAYALVSPAKFATRETVSDEEVQSYYQKNIDRYQGKGGILPLAEVKDRVKSDALQQKAAKDAYEKAADAVNKNKGNADLNAAAAAIGASTEKTPLFTAQNPPRELAGEKEVLSRAFTLKQGELGGPVETAKGIYLVKVLERKAPAVPPLAEIKEAVRSKALEAKAAELAQQKAQGALAALAKGNLPGTRETGNFGYSPAGTVPTIGTSPELMEQAFALTAAAPVAQKAIKVGERWYAVKLKSRVEAPVADFQKQKGTLKQTLLPKKRQEVLDAWLKGLRAKAKIEINPTLMAD